MDRLPTDDGFPNSRSRRVRVEDDSGGRDTRRRGRGGGRGHKDDRDDCSEEVGIFRSSYSSSCNSVPTVMSSPFPRAELTDVQKGDLSRLWNAHAPETDGCRGDGVYLRSGGGVASSGGGGRGGGEVSTRDGIDPDTYGHVARMHAYFLAVVASWSSVSSPGGAAAAAATATATAASSPGRARTRTRKRGVGVGRGGFTNSAASSRTADAILRAVLRVRRPGRHVVPMDHAEFTSDLTRYETRRLAIRSGVASDSAERNDDEENREEGDVSPPEGYVQNHSFGAFLYHRPDQALAAAGCAFGLCAATLWRRSLLPQFQEETMPPPTMSPLGRWDAAELGRFLGGAKFVPRFVNVYPRVRMIDVKTQMAYRFVSIRGHVTKARPKRLRVVSADFRCGKCGCHRSHRFVDGRYSVPSTCDGMKCRSRTFSLVRSTASYVDHQELRLQEAQDETIADAGRTPRQLEVEVTHDLVDCCNAGDVVQVAGVVRAVNSAVAAGRTGRRALETSTYKLYVTANSVANMTAESREEGGRGRMDGGGGGGATSAGGGGRSSGGAGSTAPVSYTEEQIESFVRIAHADHRIGPLSCRMAFPFDLLVRSLCPSIVGHDAVKAGILLALLGGTPPELSGLNDARSSGMSIRSNSHVLVVGDPGMGKSQMLLAASQVASRSVYVGGNTASTTGLTVSLTKEAGGEVGIEAGALVLADQGVCCIDEFDKMAKAHQDGLLEAMEQQQISIAKAGVVASLPARCSVVAAANPRHGNYNMGKTVAENLNMATPILSRFDLVFILRDKADEDQDRIVSSNIMDLYRRRDAGGRIDSGGVGSVRSDIDYLESAVEVFESSVESNRDDERPKKKKKKQRIRLARRLQWVAEMQATPLPADTVRDYISYCREYCRPKMTQAAAKVLKDHFMRLRYPEGGSMSRNDTVPITTRQLEALIRLSQARAKACLQEYVLEEDAYDVVELMKLSVEQVHTDEDGNVDRMRGGAGGTSNRKGKKRFEEEVRKIARGKECLVKQDFSRASELAGLDASVRTEDMIQYLRDHSVILKQGDGSYKLNP